MGYVLNSPNEKELIWDGTTCNPAQSITIDTYNDHRMAMAFAPAVMVFPQIKINNPEVVNKSYPQFWNDLKQLGVDITDFRLYSGRN